MDLITTGGATVTMTSREIADLTGKELSHIHRDIRVMLDELKKDDPDLNHPREDKDSRGYTTCFYLSRELTETLLTGYSVSARLKVIRRWHELEESKVPALPNFSDPVAAARAWADQVEKTQQQAVELQTKQLLLEQQQPAVDFMGDYVGADGLFRFRDVTKLTGVNERVFRQFLVDNRIMYELNGRWVAFQPHIDAGRFCVKTGVNRSNGHAFNDHMFTAKGIAWVAELINKRAPTIRQRGSRGDDLFSAGAIH